MIGIHIVAGEHAPLFDGIDRGGNLPDAACAGVDPELFFPEPVGRLGGRHVDWDTPRVICDSCPVRDACLQAALDRESGSGRHRFGMWGGKTPDERAWIARRRHRKPHAYIPIAERVAPTHRPQCGTAMGYETHRRNGERPCDPCRTAASKYQAERRARRAG